jgi:hypothetical protein
MQPDMPLWKEVLVAKYGRHILHHVDWGDFQAPRFSSLWWKDICALERVVPGNWINEAIQRVVGDGSSTLFWLTNWIGEAPLARLYPRLYSLSTYKENMVHHFGVRRGDTYTWSFTWRRELFAWENELVLHLQDRLASVRLLPEEDMWRWIPEVDGFFSVKLTYLLLETLLRPMEVIVEEEVLVFEHIWESPAPSKVIAFSWQLLYDRIPTRLNLSHRGIIAIEESRECVVCVGRVESSTHLFMHCPFAMRVWYDIFRWLGVNIVIPPSIALLFEMFRGLGRNKKLRQGFTMIWHATIWSIWKVRNSVIFANGVLDLNALVDEVKVTSWKCSLARLNLRPCLFYEWVWDPGECLLR